MHNFLSWLIPILSFGFLELISWRIDKRLISLIPTKTLRFFIVRLLTVILLTFIISNSLFLFSPENPLPTPAIFTLLCVIYLILWLYIMFA